MRKIKIDYKKPCILFILLLIIAGMAGCGKKVTTTHTLTGMKALESFQYEAALESFTNAQKSGEDLRSVYRGEGLALMGLARYEEAVAAFETALTCSSGQVDELDYDINYYMAVAQYKIGDFKGAVKTYNAIIDLQPKRIRTYFLRGCALLQLDKGQQALKDFEYVMKKDSDNYAVYCEIYQVLAKYGYEEEGKKYLVKLLEDKKNSMTDSWHGVISYYLKDYETARTYLERAKTNGDEMTMLMLGKTYEALGDNNYAATVYTDYVSKNANSILVANQLALCKMKLQDYKGALEAIEAAMKLEPNDAMQTLKFNEIICYEYLGDFKKATVLMESYLSTYPDDEEALREYQFLKTR